MSHRRATATVLFTDVVGSTRMRTELGDEDADAVRREHDARMRDAIAVHGGETVKTLGDGFMVAFESAGAAVACSVDIQRAIDRQAHRGPVALAVRIGIGAGDVAWEDGDVFGTPVVEAQRLCALAGAGGGPGHGRGATAGWICRGALPGGRRGGAPTRARTPGARLARPLDAPARRHGTTGVGTGRRPRPGLRRPKARTGHATPSLGGRLRGPPARCLRVGRARDREDAARRPNWRRTSSATAE
jgi:hypothetical protein